jgi:hypothetical protein
MLDASIEHWPYLALKAVAPVRIRSGVQHRKRALTSRKAGSGPSCCVRLCPAYGGDLRVSVSVTCQQRATYLSPCRCNSSIDTLHRYDKLIEEPHGAGFPAGHEGLGARPDGDPRFHGVLRTSEPFGAGPPYRPRPRRSSPRSRNAACPRLRRGDSSRLAAHAGRARTGLRVPVLRPPHRDRRIQAQTAGGPDPRVLLARRSPPAPCRLLGTRRGEAGCRPQPGHRLRPGAHPDFHRTATARLCRPQRRRGPLALYSAAGGDST